MDVIGVGPEGWVPLDQYEEANQRENKLKAGGMMQLSLKRKKRGYTSIEFSMTLMSICST